MRLFLLRHAIAAPRDAERFPDDRLRPVTPEGRRRMQVAVRGMRTLGLRFDVVLSSPLLRARQTADIVLAGLRPRPPLRIYRPLAPGGGAGTILAGLATLAPADAILLVGHEPDLSGLAGGLILDPRADLPIEFKKGGLCRIDFEGAPRPGGGRLIFHLPPKILRRIG